MNDRKYHNNTSFIYLPLGYLIFLISSWYPTITESFYSGKLYRLIIPLLSRFTGMISFSIAEIIICLILFLSIFSLYRLLFRRKTTKNLSIKKMVMVLGVTYLVFVLSWGINYNRLTFSEIANLEIAPATVNELENLTKNLILTTNKLREMVLEDNHGVMILSTDIPDMLDSASKGYLKAANSYPELAGTYGKPKAIFFSEALAYLGIGGFYFPFTAEANINKYLPQPMLPFVTTHEMAHQRGFAREDEANYIAYLTSNSHPSIDFQYSGNLMALMNVMKELKKHSPEKAAFLKEQYSAGVKRDINAIYVYREKYNSPLERLSMRINDLFLKANMEKDGVESYGRMIDILIAEYRLKT